MYEDQTLFLSSASGDAHPRKALDFTSWDGVAPRILEYPLISLWKPTAINIRSLKTLAKALYYGATTPRPMCVVRGELIDPFADVILRRSSTERGEPTLQSCEHRWVCLDIDRGFVQGDLHTVEGCNKAANDLRVYLPEALRDAECIAHFSSTARNQKVKCHFWLWLPQSVCDEAMRYWAKTVYRDSANKAIFDPSVFKAAQPHYIADPLLIGEPQEGWVVAKRWHFIEGRTITKEMMPREWMDGFAWNREQMQIAAIAQEARMLNFKPTLQNKNSEQYARGVTRGLIEDIQSVAGCEGDRHQTIRDKAHRALRMQAEGILSPAQIDEIRQAAYGILPRERHKEVDRLFREAGRVSTGPQRRTMQIKRAYATIIRGDAPPPANETKQAMRTSDGVASDATIPSQTEQLALLDLPIACRNNGKDFD